MDHNQRVKVKVASFAPRECFVSRVIAKFACIPRLCLRLQEYLTQTYTGLLRNQHHVVIALTEELNNERRDV